MEALWRIKRGSVAEVRAEHRRGRATALAYTTVMTLLGRLAAKGAVRVDKSRQPFLYRPAFRRDSLVRERLRRFVAEAFDGRAEALVLRLVDDGVLTVDQLRRIERRLRTARGDGDPGGAG
jgi:predicted transcriptional regulator